VKRRAWWISQAILSEATTVGQRVVAARFAPSPPDFFLEDFLAAGATSRLDWDLRIDTINPSRSVGRRSEFALRLELSVRASWS
jgi:hypothetical protein